MAFYIQAKSLEVIIILERHEFISTLLNNIDLVNSC